jgi:hypothetical protein
VSFGGAKASSVDADTDYIREKLVAMAEEDQAVREELGADGSLFHGYHPRMEEVHRRNAAALLEIVERHGWPVQSLVGEHAARAAWIILQHAIGNPSLQRRGLRWLQEAAALGEVAPVEVAMLEDRIRCYEGRPQRYGTQFDWDASGQISPYPVEDPEGVDRRRAAIGLGPLDEAVRLMRELMAQGPEVPPTDWAERQRQKELWLRTVGWR